MEEYAESIAREMNHDEKNNDVKTLGGDAMTTYTNEYVERVLDELFRSRVALSRAQSDLMAEGNRLNYERKEHLETKQELIRYKNAWLEKAEEERKDC